MFLLDTDHAVILQYQTKPEYPRLADRMERHALTDFYVSIVSFQEEVSGWNAYLNRARTTEGIVRAYAMFEEVLRYFTIFQVLSFDDAAAQIFNALRSQRVRIGTMDLRIAAIALARGYTVLSRNLVDFRQVPGLAIEDWT